MSTYESGKIMLNKIAF